MHRASNFSLWLQERDEWQSNSAECKRPGHSHQHVIGHEVWAGWSCCALEATRDDQKVLQFNDTSKTTASFFNTISLHINTLATLIKGSLIPVKQNSWGIHGLLELIIVAKPLSTKMLLQTSKQAEIVRCQVCWVRWMRQLFNSDVLD